MNQARPSAPGRRSGPSNQAVVSTPYKPFPKYLLDPERQERLVASVGGVEASSIEELSIRHLSVDGHAGSLLTMTIDAGEWKRRFFNVRVDIGDDASIELLFAFDPSSLNDEVLRDILATVHLDASLIDQALQQAAERGASS
jgi:hypothetical protein